MTAVSYAYTGPSIVGLALALMASAASPAWGQSAWPSYPNNTAIFVTSSGDVGIGTTSPALPLDVFGVGRFAVSSGGNNNVLINADSQGSLTSGLTIGYNQVYNGVSMSNAGYLQGETQGSAYRNLLLDPLGGNVGIGTTSPAGKLTVQPTVSNSQGKT